MTWRATQAILRERLRTAVRKPIPMDLTELEETLLAPLCGPGLPARLVRSTDREQPIGASRADRNSHFAELGIGRVRAHVRLSGGTIPEIRKFLISRRQGDKA